MGGIDILIPTINKLQDVFNTVGGELIDLPQIVVVGSQSSGKSSVLESIVGTDFLPRGSGIVTRRPLILQLVHIHVGEDFGVFTHCPEKRFTSYLDIRAEIEAETERTCKGKDVSPHPINLRISSMRVPTLTMVDLPGLTKVAVEGQDHSVVEAIRTMVLQYITPENALILAITPANQDLANSDALRIARDVDPEGRRTLGVITKVDTMEIGTDAGAILRNEVYPLKMGYIGVINRSQREIDTRMPMEKALAREEETFRQHVAYRNLMEHCGMRVLVKKLVDVLVVHIKACLPGLRQRVTQLIGEKETELRKYGDDPAESGMQMRDVIMSIINQYCAMFKDLIEGRVGDRIDDDLKGGARITRIFTGHFEMEVASLPPVEKQNPAEVWCMMRNHAGITVPIFVAHQAFESLARRQIETLRPAALKAVNMVANEILNIHAQVTFQNLDKFPAVKDAIRTVVEDLVNACVEPTVQFVNDLIDSEKLFINTARHDFRGAAILAEKRMKGSIPVKKTKTQQDKDNTRTLMTLASRYCDLVRVQVVDLVPKAIVMLLVEGSSSELQSTLLHKVWGSNLADDLQEDPRITAARKKCRDILAALRKAGQILQEVRQVSF